MNAALAMAGYAVVVSCCVPVPLTWLTRRGVSPRLELTAWLSAIGCVLVAAVLALDFLLCAAVAGWPRLSEMVCRSVAGGACTPVVYRSAFFELALGVAALIAVVAAGAFCWRFGRRLWRGRQRSRRYADAARITGRELPGTGAIVLDDGRPAAYCVSGRPGAIVVTSGALALLPSAQIGAVLAHERAHLAGRHHLLIALTRALPGLPLFRRGQAAVARLAEMCADDAAIRRAGRDQLLAALVAMGTAGAAGSGALGATGYAVAERVERLLEPVPRGSRLRYVAAVASVIVALAAALAGVAVTW